LVNSSVFVDIFSLLCGLTGWFYLFYSRAAAKLSAIESARRNTLRVALRRICGAAMFLLGIACFAGFNTVDDRRTPRAYVSLWLGVMFLLLIILLLVAADIRLTWKLRRKPPTPSDPT
jgi:Ca2+/Na+ antiporter